MKFENNTFKFELGALKEANLGSHLVKIVLTDSVGAETKYNLNVTVWKKHT